MRILPLSAAPLAAALAAALVALPSLALAHPGHGDEAHFLSGLTHPLLGVDHLLAMVAVGLWAALAGGRAMLVLPLAFLAAMLAGGLAGAGAQELPVMEPMILASVIVLGAAVALALSLPLWVSAALVAVFGAAHGFAHGVEGPGGAEYAAGFLIATAALHGLGLALGRFGPMALRLAGGVVALGGVALALV